MQEEKAVARLRVRTGSSELSLLADAKSTIITCAEPLFVILMIQMMKIHLSTEKNVIDPFKPNEIWTGWTSHFITASRMSTTNVLTRHINFNLNTNTMHRDQTVPYGAV